jgi:hypothetical protein
MELVHDRVGSNQSNVSVLSDTEARRCLHGRELVQFEPMNWKRMLAYVTGTVDEELLARNEYLVTENRILRGQVKRRIRLTDPERIRLASAVKRLARRALEEVAQIVRPETILGWHRRLIAKKFDGSKHRKLTRLTQLTELPNRKNITG